MRYPLMAAIFCLAATFIPAQTPLQEKQAALGAQLAAQVQRRSTPLSRPDASAYIQNLGQQLAAQYPSVPADFWKFNLINNPPNDVTLEPISLPGGWIFVSSQLILATRSESELAGMLAHAMAHVLNQPPPRQTPAEISNLSAIPMAYFNGLLPRAALPMHRENELAADRAAIQTMSAAGFDPTALLNYIARVQPADDDDLSPLPQFSTRVANLQESIQALRATSPQSHPVSDQSLSAIQAEIQAFVPPPSKNTPSLLHPNNNK